KRNTVLMISITAILKEKRNKFMEKSLKLEESLKTRISSLSSTIKKYKDQLKTTLYHDKSNVPSHPFWVIVRKEITDHVSSWRFIILLSLILLTCFGSLY